MNKNLAAAKKAAKMVEYKALQTELRAAALAGNTAEVLRLNKEVNRAFKAL